MSPNCHILPVSFNTNQPFTVEYSDGLLGNLLTKSDVGSYAYATATTTGYANPDAAITIATSTLTYDNNGNVTSVATTTKFTWDYLNRLATLGSGAATSTYAYDAWGQRVKMTVATTTTATTTTFYPTKYYNLSSGTSTSVKHIFANGEEIATVSGSGTKATVSYIHTDHLGGANVVTNPSGNTSELLDYYPYGSARLDQQTSFNEQRKFIGEMYDAASQLSYLNARYYDGSKGKFMSQDPVFWEIGQTSDGKAALSNPQAMNSYSYANGNPITNKDPDGRAPGLEEVMGQAENFGPYAVMGVMAAYGLYNAATFAIDLGKTRAYTQQPDGPRIPDQQSSSGPGGKWTGAVLGAIGAGIVKIGYSYYDYFKNLSQSAQDYNQKAATGADMLDSKGKRKQVIGLPNQQFINSSSGGTALPSSQGGGGSSSTAHSFSSNCGASGSFCSPAFQKSSSGKLTPILH